MILKRGVVLAICAPMARMLVLLETTVHEITGEVVVITSAADGVHMMGSRHYTGEAIDIRSSNIDAVMKTRLVQSLRAVLGDHFDVVDEVDHIHIEFDP